MTNGQVTGLIPLLVAIPLIGITIKQVEKIGEDFEFNIPKVNKKKRR